MVLKIFGIVLFLIALVASPSVADSPTVDGIAQKLVCQCGCLSVLNNCTHGECMVRDQMLGVIEQKLAQGQSEPEIIQFFVAQYGEQVLASPPKKGFNLMAWVTPFAALLFGGAVVTFAIRAWVKRGREDKAPAAAPQAISDEYRERLEKELADFTDRGFR